MLPVRDGHTTRPAIIIMAVFLVSLGLSSSVRSEQATSGEHGAGAKIHEPAVLKRIIAAHWRLVNARAALPPVQVVHNEHLEIQDFIQYAYDGGAFRLYVSPGLKGGDIFAILVDTREARYGNFADLVSTEGYTVFHHGAYVAVIPVRPVSRDLFEKIKSRQSTADELQRQLGAPSYHWHVHGVGDSGLTYVPQGLSFIGGLALPRTAVQYRVYASDVEAEWDKVDPPPLALLAQLDYANLQRQGREGFANEAFRQRDEIDQALAIGTPSPDGHFVVGDVELEGMSWSREIVIKETSKPERRYWAGGFDLDYRWLNARTVVFTIDRLSLGEQFHTLNALTGVDKLVETVPYETVFNDDPVTDFGVSGSDRFWYKTADGLAHEVTVPNVKASTAR